MSRKGKIEDITVLRAYKQYNDKPEYTGIVDRPLFADEVLRRMTGQPWKVCWRAMERCEKKGYITVGTSLRSAWLSEKGEEALAKSSWSAASEKFQEEAKAAGVDIYKVVPGVNAPEDEKAIDD